MTFVEWVGAVPTAFCVTCKQPLVPDSNQPQMGGRSKGGTFWHCEQGHYAHKECDGTMAQRTR